MKKQNIKNGSVVEYIEPFDNQIGAKYKVVTEVVNEWCTLETTVGNKSSFTANVLDLKLTK